jgi:hypothetical protein
MKRCTLEKTLPLRLVVVDTDNNVIEVRTFKIKFNLFTIINEHEHEVTAQMGQNISLVRINFFIENFLNNSIALDNEYREEVFTRFADYENNFLVLPDLTESTLMEVLHCKLNRLCKAGSRVDNIHIYDTITEMNYTFFMTEEEEYQLPGQSEWMGEFSYWDDPWWNRSDVSTYDNSADSSEELAAWRLNMKENHVYRMAQEAFEEIEDVVKSSFHAALEHAGIVPKIERGQLIEVDFSNTNEPVKRERWTPKLI